jgi:peptide subunit release factor 1 (eRF1)
MAMLRSHSFDRLLVGGPEEALAVLLHQLPPPLRRRLDGTFRLELFASDAAVLRAVQPLLAASERRAEVAEIDELLNAATSAQVVLGIEPTLAALAEGRVHVLYLADFFGGVGGECENCGRLVPGPGPCPRCGGTVIPVADLGDRAMEQAVAQGARVDVVSGDAAARLAAQGGIGAWTRY